jgi:hypothetical protein
MALTKAQMRALAELRYSQIMAQLEEQDVPATIARVAFLMAQVAEIDAEHSDEELQAILESHS